MNFLQKQLSVSESHLFLTSPHGHMESFNMSNIFKRLKSYLFKEVTKFYYVARSAYYFMGISAVFVIFYIYTNVHYYRNVETKANITPDGVYNDLLAKTATTGLTTSIKNNNGEKKYILLWTSPNDSPFDYFGTGQKVFVEKKCKWSNCYVTADRNFLGDYTEFDVVAFNGPHLATILKRNDLPKRRFSHQKYVYANIESAASYPICTKLWNGYFNWTWTYKLDSDSVWGYMSIKNSTNDVIGPKTDIKWFNVYDMDPINEQIKAKLKSKSKAAAWFASNCNTVSLREEFVNKVQDHLRKYDLEVDIYGDCGKLYCPRESMRKCLKMLEKDYYFYFAFENALSEDYVTEKILYALKYYTVPVVFGGANYTRFMPHGIYLNARELGPENLSKKIHEIIQNPEAYYNFFKWRKYYSYHLRHESPDTDVYCQFCEEINSEKKMKTRSTYDNLSLWWSPSNTCSI